MHAARACDVPTSTELSRVLRSRLISVVESPQDMSLGNTTGSRRRLGGAATTKTTSLKRQDEHSLIVIILVMSIDIIRLMVVAHSESTDQ